MVTQIEYADTLVERFCKFNAAITVALYWGGLGLGYPLIIRCLKIIQVLYVVIPAFEGMTTF